MKDPKDGQIDCDSPEASGQVRRVARVGLAVNIALAGLKFAGGILGRSQVLIADAVHSLSDSATDVALLIGVRYWSKPPDEEHPHGHRRIETVITVAIALALVGAAVGLGYRALTTLGGADAGAPGWIAFVAAVISIVVKELLYRWTLAAGRRVRSSAVMANAWHHRSDALSSVPAALAVAFARLAPGWAFLDHVGAVVVSVLILHAAWKIGRPALGELIDTGAGEKDRTRIAASAMATPGVRAVHAVRTRYVGSAIQVDLHVLVDPDLTVRQGHDIAGAVKGRLLESQPNVIDVIIHVEPYEGN